MRREMRLRNLAVCSEHIHMHKAYENLVMLAHTESSRTSDILVQATTEEPVINDKYKSEKYLKSMGFRSFSAS